MEKIVLKTIRKVIKPIVGKGYIDRYFPFLIGFFQIFYSKFQTEETKVVEIPLGIKLKVFTKDIGIGLPLILKGVYEKKQTEHFLRELENDDIFIDVGANVGYYTLLASKKLTRGKVFSFEPDKKTASILKENIEANKLVNVEVFEKALSDRTGKIRFNEEKFNKGESSITVDKGSETDSVMLDDFARQKALKPSIIKIDIEGAEIMALKGARKTFINNKIRLYIEVNPRSLKMLGGNLDGLISELLSEGFKPQEIIDESKEVIIPYSSDALLNVFKHTTYCTLFCSN